MSTPAAILDLAFERVINNLSQSLINDAEISKNVVIFYIFSIDYEWIF